VFNAPKSDGKHGKHGKKVFSAPKSDGKHGKKVFNAPKSDGKHGKKNSSGLEFKVPRSRPGI
jgi:hypothetical protein